MGGLAFEEEDHCTAEGKEEMAGTDRVYRFYGGKMIVVRACIVGTLNRALHAVSRESVKARKRATACHFQETVMGSECLK